ncbi:MAG TPA: putative LPS assembly protein LptD [Salinimicrobium sp.]|nr:putative LPS assembly protein LptD [Salinimicrobium sp.]
MRTDLFHIALFSLFLLIFSAHGFSQEIGQDQELNIEARRDTARSVSTLRIEETILETPQDTTKIDSVVKEKPLLTDIVTYSADDYMRINRTENRMYLHDNAKITYGDIEITAGLIILDNEKNEVYAFGITDSTGTYVQKPVFTQAQNVVEPDSIRFNFETEKALVFNSHTEQGVFKVRGEVTKRENDSVFFMKNVRFTTSTNIEDPEYYFYARKIKFVPDEKIVTGLVNMYIADVPTPLGLPFAYFPLTDEETSGFILPSIGESNSRGYFLQNGGYYFAISDYADLTVLGDYYTNGSYGLRVESAYGLRYKFRGNVSFRLENLIESERGFPDYSQRSVYNIRWNHTRDQKANPSSRFTASVNLGSSKYYRESINQMNTGNRLNNTMSSSVSYQKTFQGEPQVNFTVAATHSQNTNTETIELTLPTLQASVSRIFPFQPKFGTKKGIIQNINFQYNLRAENRFLTTDSLFFQPEMFEGAMLGAQHSVPISTNFKIFNYLNVNANTNYNENWVFKTFEKSYDPILNEVVTDTVQGFDSFRTYNFSTSVSTTVYGMANFGEDKKIQAVRHVMSPSVSYNIFPGFSQYYDSYALPGLIEGEEVQNIEYTRFSGSMYGAPSNKQSSNIGFTLKNTLEAKVRAKDSTDAETTRKITLIKNLNFQTAYNLEADSIKLQPIGFTGSIPIIKDKLDINFNGALDIYALDNSNRRINTLNIDNGGSLFRLTNASASFGYSFANTDFDKDTSNDSKLENETFRNGGRQDDLFGKNMNLDGTFEENEDKEPVLDENEFYNYKIPWNIRVAYNINYDNRMRQGEITSHSLMFSGDIELSPRWSIGASSGYDFKNNGFSFTQLRFQRDLESWRLSFSWIPFSTISSWNFFIGIKSSVLSDIKYEKNREPDRQL